MKARSNLVSTLVMATGCCCISLSLFCADPAKRPNRQKRIDLQQEYEELTDRETLSLEEHQKVASIAQTLKDAESALYEKNSTEIWRERKIREWHARELKAENAIILETLKNKDKQPEEITACLQKQHAIAHTLKVLYAEEVSKNPYNSEAKEEAQKFMTQSLVLGQYESLLRTQEETSKATQEIPDTTEKSAEEKKNCIIL